jgi:hypothetical protein
MFAHVLNLPESEDIWPGEWVSQFPQVYFDARLADRDTGYLACGRIWEHMRWEMLRMAKGVHFLEGTHEYALNALIGWAALKLSLANVFDSPEKLPQALTYTFNDVEHSVLDESMIVPLRPHRPVRTISPTEQEDD